ARGCLPLWLSARLRRTSALRAQPDNRRPLPPVRAAAHRAFLMEVLASLPTGAPCRGGAALLEADRALRERAPGAGCGGRCDWIPAPGRVDESIPHGARARPALCRGRALA